MEVKVLNESGYKQAVSGIGFSYGIDDYNRLEGVGYKLCDKDGGHNKFLESIMVWIEITAARYWWQEFDTYRVGTTKQSESTIHTLAKKALTQNNFEHPILKSTIDHMNNLIRQYTNEIDRKRKKEWFNLIKANLPEGYLQKRMVCTNYKSLSNMIAQRKHHVLKEWHDFIENVLDQIEHPELLLKRYGEERPWKLKG
jgi:hypothetical protein